MPPPPWGPLVSKATAAQCRVVLVWHLTKNNFKNLCSDQPLCSQLGRMSLAGCVSEVELLPYGHAIRWWGVLCCQWGSRQKDFGMLTHISVWPLTDKPYQTVCANFKWLNEDKLILGNAAENQLCFNCRRLIFFKLHLYVKLCKNPPAYLHPWAPHYVCNREFMVGVLFWSSIIPPSWPLKAASDTVGLSASISCCLNSVEAWLTIFEATFKHWWDATKRERSGCLMDLIFEIL